MFISLQMPFTDLRPFIKNAPERLDRITFDPRFSPPNAYVRSFGKIKGRGYVPAFAQANTGKSPLIFYEHWEDLPDLWVDEYHYSWAKNGLRFPALEKHKLLEGKLTKPRVKVRALHYSPYPSSKFGYSPAIRIETGIVYKVAQPLTGDDLEEALRRFLIIPSKVTKYDYGSCADLCKKKQKKKLKFIDAPLIYQFPAISDLLVKATTSQSETRIHPQMVPGAAPILTVHFFPDELKDGELPCNTVWLPKKLTSGLKIGYFPLKACGSLVGTWLFELPTGSKKSLSVRKKREIIRNYTIAVMRYWSELQGCIAAIKLLHNKKFGNAIDIGKNSNITNFINTSSHFLQQKRWHKANLNIIKNISNAYSNKISKREISLIQDGEVTLNRQIAEKTNTVLSEIGKPVAFLSYSHKDKHWQQVIQNIFAPLHKTGQFTYFDDNDIDAGSSWKKRIIDAIANANVAILLISNNFFNSEFINENELPRIFDAHKKCKLEVIPVMVEHIDENHLSINQFLVKIQFLNKNEPLCTMNSDQLEVTLQKLKQTIKSFF